MWLEQLSNEECSTGSEIFGPDALLQLYIIISSVSYWEILCKFIINLLNSQPTEIQSSVIFTMYSSYLSQHFNFAE